MTWDPTKALIVEVTVRSQWRCIEGDVYDTDDMPVLGADIVVRAEDSPEALAIVESVFEDHGGLTGNVVFRP